MMRMTFALLMVAGMMCVPPAAAQLLETRVEQGRTPDRQPALEAAAPGLF
jgi:hypothetical protein